MAFDMKALKVLVDKDFEDDGLYAVTLWVDLEPPRYISISRDVFEEPDVIYIEAQDQIYGKKTINLRYSISDLVLRLYFTQDADERFHWNNRQDVSISIDKENWDEMLPTLNNIFDR
ncbi:hypothetical protein NNQ28_16970 [Cronobacter dublinensis]|uniref:hypothetical protein n=1 Tax=Cronobacter dublinensis TaxID=413497 RepID=UPI00137608E7|nr:hypothetical protein [Cronobacter dublinensis]ELY2739324.1 hypothetical protein [Cronobacter dublinensis]ELY2855695.1 hypothetical protein [Cronobacter dublinensis]ELY2909861.1 hypothetical protein [Cronobacter dublinensis]NCH73696.1 hypothetical protein [Cronobacter dublinensis]WNY81978.1 hypothetical protein NNQ28_16970 [Cronobacter dublinensis]